MSKPGDGDDDKVRQFLTGLLAFVPLILWVTYVVLSIAADHGADEQGSVPGWLEPFGVGSGVALATIAGAWLGIKSEPMVEVMSKLRLSWAGWATLVYVMSLVAATIAFAVDPQRDNSADLVQASLATLFGFGLGAFKAKTSPET